MADPCGKCGHRHRYQHPDESGPSGHDWNPAACINTLRDQCGWCPFCGLPDHEGAPEACVGMLLSVRGTQRLERRFPEDG